MVPNWSWVIGLLFGATIGSFLNVVIYRLPRGLSLSNPPKSFCPNCKHSLGFADLFPLFSWLVSRGKCRYCAQPIASRYVWVELLNGSLWAVIWWQFLIASNEPLRGAFYAITSSALVAVIFIDWELYIIPDELNATLLVFGIAYHAFDKSLPVALWGALWGWGLLWGIALFGRVLFRKDAMGHGDIKMMRGVGALLGPGLLVANLAIAVVAGLVIGITMLVVASKTQSTGPGDGDAASEGEEEFLPPESIVSLLVHGAFYLFCLDIVAIFVPSIYKWIGETPSEENIDDDDWKPSLTTIPFGPYLAIGAVVCMLFAAPIEKATSDYWQKATHPVSLRLGQKRGFVGIVANRLNWGASRVETRSIGYHIAGAMCDPSLCAGGIDWNVTMRADLVVTVGNNTPLQAVTQGGKSGVKDAC